MFQNLLKRIGRGLDKIGIPYMVVGGQAILLYGEPRLTKDIDITLGVGIDELEKIKSVTKKLKLKALVNKVDAFVKETMVLPVIDERSAIRVDFIFSHSLYEKHAIQRAKNIEFGKTTVRFASLEDVVIYKVIAGRPRDIEDIKSVLLKNPRYDTAYITKWLKDFDRSLGENFLETFKRIVKEIK